MKVLHRFARASGARWTRPRPRVCTAILALALAGWATSRGAAAETAPAAVSPVVIDAASTVAPIDFGDDELIIREVFHSHLPKTLRKHALRLGLHPHVGDFNTKDHLRITTGVRYGLSENCEISTSSDLYTSHGHGDVPSFDRYGAANLEFGTKLNLGQPLVSGWDIATGFDYALPLGRPPPELTDGLRHFMPYVTFSRRLESPRGLRIFWGLRLDAVTHTSVPGEFKKNALRDDSTGITGGFVIDRKNWHYTFEASFDTTQLIGDASKEVFRIRPGVIWEILSRRRPGARSNWVVGAAVSCTSGPGGTHLGASLKLRYNRNLKNRFRRGSDAAAP
jgi:hypothetical protein